MFYEQLSCINICPNSGVWDGVNFPHGSLHSVGIGSIRHRGRLLAFSHRSHACRPRLPKPCHTNPKHKVIAVWRSHWLWNLRHKRKPKASISTVVVAIITSRLNICGVLIMQLRHKTIGKLPFVTEISHLPMEFNEELCSGPV